MPVCFPAVADERTDRMIIGSMPGAASLKAHQYYAHPRNAFWKIVAELFGAAYPFESYDAKLSLLLKNGVGLWDVFASCDRDGSLDSDIRNAVAIRINAGNICARHTDRHAFLILDHWIGDRDDDGEHPGVRAGIVCPFLIRIIGQVQRRLDGFLVGTGGFLREAGAG